jgi:hypothetical protein
MVINWFKFELTTISYLWTDLFQNKVIGHITDELRMRPG